MESNKFINLKDIPKNTLAINFTELEEVIKKRLLQGIKLESLFLVTQCDQENEYDLETRFGKLKVFALRNCPKNLLLHRKKYNYPTISKVSTRPFQKIGDKESNLIN